MLQQQLKMDFSEQITILQENMRHSHGKRDSKFKFITSEKWRSIMTRALQRMKKKQIYDANLLDDMMVIVESIKEAKFIEAILNIEPFRPNFLLKKRDSNDKKHKESVENIEEYDNEKVRTKLTNNPKLEYRNSIIRFKQSVNEKISESLNKTQQSTIEPKDKQRKSLLEEMLSYVTEEETLVREFQGKGHPFRKIIEQYLFLVENKYKNMMEGQKTLEIEDIQEKLILDVKLIQEFIVKSSEPYITIFKTDNHDEKAEFQLKMIAFLKQYIERHDKINALIRKIMRIASRKTTIVSTLCLKLPDFVEINGFDIKDLYRIDGCYIQSMNALMEFAEAHNSKITLEKLKEFRVCLSRDVDEYYAGREGAPQQREIGAEMQIEIIKFILSKLKYFIGEIYAQLKFLEVVYGESDMSYKYDDSSYMYAQISFALEALQIDHN